MKITKKLIPILLAAVMICCVFNTTSQDNNAAKKPAIKTVAVTSDGVNVTKKTITLVKGKKATLKVNVTPTNALKKKTFSSNKKKYATVSSKGVITAKKDGGTAKITIKAKGKNNKTKSTWVKVKVIKATQATAAGLCKNGATHKYVERLTPRVFHPAVKEKRTVMISPEHKQEIVRNPYVCNVCGADIEDLTMADILWMDANYQGGWTVKTLVDNQVHLGYRPEFYHEDKGCFNADGTPMLIPGTNTQIHNGSWHLGEAIGTGQYTTIPAQYQTFEIEVTPAHWTGGTTLGYYCSVCGKKK